MLSVCRTVIDDMPCCSLCVADTGKGIPLKLQDRIFDSFITGDNNPLLSTKVGIGMRIVKNTMDLHHGTVTLDSTPEKGSVFTLFVPEGKAHFDSDSYEIIEASSSWGGKTLRFFPLLRKSEKKNGNRRSLLVIEDNPEVRGYVCSLFSKAYTVWEAADGQQGVDMALEKVPDLIISDVMMPVKDGFACCREIREHVHTAHIPILMLTAKAEDVDRLQASGIGVDDYMMKPFNPELLKSRVENLILQRERLKRLYTKMLMLKQPEASGEPEASVTDDFIRQVVNVIEAHLSDETFNVKILAEQLNMSQPTLYRKIKQSSDLSAIDMIRSIRMSKAASLIMTHRYTIQRLREWWDIAIHVHLESTSRNSLACHPLSI